MYCKKTLFVCLLFALGSGEIQAQSNQKNASLEKTVKDIGSLFKKKKKDSVTVAPGTAAQPGVPGTASSGSLSTVPGSVKGEGGGLAPGVKYLDADQLFDFNTGAAIVRKGNSSALIDPKGNFIVPFNKYDFTYSVIGVSGYDLFSNGLIRYRTLDQQQWAFMNASAKTIAVGVMNDLTENKRMLQVRVGTVWTYTTASGKQYAFKDALSDIRDGIGILRIALDNNTKVVWSYRKLTGEPLSNMVYDEAYHFSEGMAVVGKKNEFGEMKYGYINTAGKQVIPFVYSIQPSEFRGGFAKVVPRDKTEFEYAFINKAGTIVLKQTLKDVTAYGAFGHFNPYGLAINFKYVMDTTFKMVPKKDFFAGFGITTEAWFLEDQNSVEGESNPKLAFSIRGVISPYTRLPIVGFINLATRKVVMPAFDLLNLNRIYFDPTAKLAYAKVCLGKDARGSLVYREGYINEDGLFVMVKGSGEKW